MSYLRFVFHFIAALALLVNSAQARQQIVGVPVGEQVDFAKGQVQRKVAAFCLEKSVSGFPSGSQRLPNVTGRLRIEFHDPQRAPIEVDAAKAVELKLVEFYGSEYLTATIKADPSVARVKFLSAAALGQEEVTLSPEEWAQIHQQAEELLSRVNPAKSALENQKTIHLNQQLFLEHQVPGKNLKVYRTANCDPKRFMSVSFFQLRSQGDVSLVRSPDGRYILHDAGAAADEMETILAQVEPDTSGVKRFAICITHADYDHYKGLTWLLDAQKNSGGKIIIESIMIGALPEKLAAYKSNPGLSAAFTTLLDKVLLDYEFDSKTGDYSHFVSKLKKDEAKVTDAPGIIFDAPSWDSDRNIDGMDFEVLQLRDMNAGAKAHRHDQNIIARYTLDEFSLADYGDAMPQQIRQMLSTPLDQAREELEFANYLAPLPAQNMARRQEVLEYLRKSPGDRVKHIDNVIQQFPAALQAKAKEYQAASRKLKDLYQSDHHWEEVLAEQGKSTKIYVDLISQPEVEPLVNKLDALLGVQNENATVEDLTEMEKELADMKEEISKNDQTLKKKKAALALKKETGPNEVLLQGGEVQAAYPQFKVQVAKWPHHAWMPRSPSDISTMKAWLKTYRPEILVVNVPFDPLAPKKWQASRDRLEEIKKLVEEVRREEKEVGRVLPTRVLSTEEMGIEFQALFRLLPSIWIASTAAESQDYGSVDGVSHFNQTQEALAA